MIDRYAGISLRCRELLAGPRGAAARAVIRVVPIEELIDPHEELIAASDALLRPGNPVRIEGRFSPSTYQIRSPQRQGAGAAQGEQRPDEIAQALERTAIVTRNADPRRLYQPGRGGGRDRGYLRAVRRSLLCVTHRTSGRGICSRALASHTTALCVPRLAAVDTNVGFTVVRATCYPRISRGSCPGGLTAAAQP